MSGATVVDFEQVNRPMLEADIGWVERRSEASELRRMIVEYARRDLPLFNGHLKNSNLHGEADGFRLTHWCRMWEYVSVFVHAVKPLRPEATILDCGGAGSYFPFWLAEQGRDVTVIDIDRFHTRLSGLVAEERELSRLRFSVENMTALRAPAATFDCVYSVSVLEHLPKAERRKALAEMARVLKPGGVIGLTFDFGDLEVSSWNATEETKYGGLACITGVEEIAEIYEGSGLEVMGNALSPAMNRLRQRPRREEFYGRYALPRMLTATSTWTTVLRYVGAYGAFRLSPKLFYSIRRRRRRQSTKGRDYNFFRLFLQKPVR